MDDRERVEAGPLVALGDGFLLNLKDVRSVVFESFSNTAAVTFRDGSRVDARVSADGFKRFRSRYADQVGAE